MASQPLVEERSRTVGVVDVTATVESHMTVYGSPDGDERETAAAPTVGATSTPKASVMGRSFNPLAGRSLENLPTSAVGTTVLRRAGFDKVGHSRPRVRWKRGPTFIAGWEGTCLDTRTTLESYGGILGSDPPSVAFVHITRFDADSVVIATAVHGHDIEDTEREFVGPDRGYLSPNSFEEASRLSAEASAALQYGSEGSPTDG